MNAEGTVAAWGTPFEGDAPSSAASPDPPDPGYAGLIRLAAALCDAEFAALSLTNGGELWCSALNLLPASAVSQSNGLTQVNGQAVTPCADVELRHSSGCSMGRLAIYSTVERTLSDSKRASLALVASEAVSQAELRNRALELALLSPGADVAAMAHALLESAPVAIYHAAVSSKMSYVNPAYRRVFGLSLLQSDEDWAQAVHTADRARIEEIWTDFRHEPRTMKFEYRMEPKDDVVRYLCEELVPIAGISGFVGTISDFTDLVAARDGLRKAESLFLNTFDQAPIGITYTDRNGRITRSNPAFCAMLNYTRDDLETRSRTDLMHADDQVSGAADLEKLWSGKIDIVDAEKRYLRMDGTALWVRATTALVRDDDGLPECAVEFVRDVTERKQSAQNLERVHKELVSASRLAGMAEVATNVLHNVGNILNSVNISASLVAERVKQSKAPGLSRVAALLKEQGPRLGEYIMGDVRGKRIPEYLASLGEQLIADQQMTLQELASLRANLEHIKDTVTMQQSYAKLCGVTEIIEVPDLVEDSLRLNAGAFVRHGVTLEREYTVVPAISVDRHKVLQILVNLIRNAKYACDESGRTDKLVKLRIEAAAGGVRISVIDNGVGIAPENMGRLFSHGFTTRKSGHGFGLHSGALAAQDLGGTLHAESAGPGQGAAFILELPSQPREDIHG